MGFRMGRALGLEPRAAGGAVRSSEKLSESSKKFQKVAQGPPKKFQKVTISVQKFPQVI
jgi:hypothetical protein